MISMPASRLELFSFDRNGGGEDSAALDSSCLQELKKIWAGVGGRVPHSCAWVEGCTFQKPDAGLIISDVKTQAFRKNVDIRTFPYRCESSRAFSPGGHDERPGLVRQTRPNRTSFRRRSGGTLAEVESVSTILAFVQAAGTFTIITYSVESPLSCECVVLFLM